MSRRVSNLSTGDWMEGTSERVQSVKKITVSASSLQNPIIVIIIITDINRCRAFGVTYHTLHKSNHTVNKHPN